MFMRLPTLAVLLASTMLMQHANAISFNCAKAGTPAEKLICSDNQLGKLDSQLSDLYSSLTTGAYKREGLVASERLWLKTVRDSCDTVSCMQNAYLERIQSLESLSKPVQLRSCSLPKPPNPKKECQQTLVCAENADHTFFQAAGNTCTKGETTSYSIDIYRHANKSATPEQIGYVANLDDIKSLNWNEQDRNGYAELDVTTACGSGPNCTHQLMHFDPDSNSMYDYFTGGYSDIDYFDGYLIEHGRGGYDEWEIHAYKMHPQGKRDIVEKKMFIIAFNGPPDGDQTCSYFIYSEEGSKTKPINPPNDKWYKRYCPRDGKIR